MIFLDSSEFTRQHTVHKNCPFVVCSLSDTCMSLLDSGGTCHFTVSAGFLKENKLLFVFLPYVLWRIMSWYFCLIICTKSEELLEVKSPKGKKRMHDYWHTENFWKKWLLIIVCVSVWMCARASESRCLWSHSSLIPWSWSYRWSWGTWPGWWELTWVLWKSNKRS